MHMSIRSIHMEIEAYTENIKQKTKDDVYQSWLNGKYVADALMATVGNMFAGKGKKFEYPKAPNLEEEKRVEDMTEEEKQKAIEALFANLAVRKANFDAMKKIKEENKTN